MKQHEKPQFHYSEEENEETIQQIKDAYNSGVNDQEDQEENKDA